MWDDNIDATLASLWEFLASQTSPVDTTTIRRKTGLPLPRIVASLAQLSEIQLLSICDRKQDLWELKKPITALEWARAVEAGVPLICLEQTMALSVSERKKAEKALASGLIDEERTGREKRKAKERQEVIRGRAASRAAATDLAKIVEDAHTALAQKSSKVNDIFRQEASNALEALIQAIERNRASPQRNSDA